MNKKYLFLLLIIIGIIMSPFFLKHDTSQIVTKHYKNEEVSLDYPADWQELKIENTQIAVFKDPQTG